jgi:hypothetical protein
MDQSPPQAISLFADGFAIQYRQRIIDYGMKHRAAVISGGQYSREVAQSAVMGLSYPSLIADWLIMWIASSKELRHRNCQSNGQRNSKLW